MPARTPPAAHSHARRRRAPIVAVAAFAAFALGALVRAAGADSPLTIGLLPVALPLGDGSGEVALLVVIEIAPGDAGATLAHGAIQLSLRDAHGEERGNLDQPIELRPDLDASRGIRLYAEFRLAPGTYALEATAHDEATGATGSSSTEVKLPAGGSGVWMASPALVVDRRPGWLTARADQPSASRVPFAFLAPSGGAYLPAAAIEVGANERIVAQAFIAAPTGEFPFVVAEAIDARGGAARAVPATVTRVARSAYPGVVAVALELGPLEPPGDYRLRLGLAAPDGRLETPIGSSLAVRVRDRPATPANAGTFAAALPALSPDADLESRYRRILATLAAAGVKAAAPELVRFEVAARSPSAGGKRPKSNAELRDAERAVVDAIVRAAGPGVEPARFAIAALDLAAAALYRDQGAPGVAAESAQSAADLLSALARDTDSALRTRAVDLLALANPLRALAVDPDHPLALLRRAIDQERTRQLLDASQTLARLLRAQPSNAEARLRSAVLLHRRGEVAAARDELARLVAAPAVAPWVLELAYSELATLERQLGRPAEAERWLRQGIERTEAQSLHLQLAFCLDQANRAAEATAVVNRLPVVGTDAPFSARQLYTIEPVEETAAARARVAAALVEALPALGRALAAAAGRGAGR